MKAFFLSKPRFREPSLWDTFLKMHSYIVTGFIYNIGLCIGARFWPWRANCPIAKIKQSSVLFLFQRVIIGIVLSFIVAIAELYFMARVEIWLLSPFVLASHANVLRGSSRVPTPRGMVAWRTRKNVCVGGYFLYYISVNLIVDVYKL